MIIDEAALAAELLARHGVTTTTRLAAIGIGRRAVDHHRDVIVLVEAHVGAVSVKLDSSVE